MNHTTIIQFAGEDFEVLTVDGRKAMTAETIGRHFKYAEPRKSINKLFNRYRDEFEEGLDASVVNLATEAGPRETIIFFETGAILLTMFTEQPEGKRYRKIFKHILAGAAKPVPPKNKGYREGLRYALECNPGGPEAMARVRQEHIERHQKTIAQSLQALSSYGVTIVPAPPAAADAEYVKLLQEHVALQQQHIALLQKLNAPTE